MPKASKVERFRECGRCCGWGPRERDRGARPRSAKFKHPLDNVILCAIIGLLRHDGGAVGAGQTAKTPRCPARLNRNMTIARRKRCAFENREAGTMPEPAKCKNALESQNFVRLCAGKCGHVRLCAGFGKIGVGNGGASSAMGFSTASAAFRRLAVGTGKSGRGLPHSKTLSRLRMCQKRLQRSVFVPVGIA